MKLTIHYEVAENEEVGCKGEGCYEKPGPAASAYFKDELVNNGFTARRVVLNAHLSAFARSIPI